MSAPGAAATRGYLTVFVALAALTAAEVGVVYVPGIGRPLLITALVLMALGKAGLVLMAYMHLAHETRALRRAILVPFVLPAVFALVLMAEAMWRFP